MIKPVEQAHKIYVGPEDDSSRWNKFKPRAGDIVVNSTPKSGTTWTQGIVAMLIEGRADVDPKVLTKYPWIDFNIRPIDEVIADLDAQDHRRQVKSHTPLDGLPYWDELRYVTVYRHPIDVHFSYRRHAYNMRPDFIRAHYPKDPMESFEIFLRGDHQGGSLQSIVTHYVETLKRKDRENLLCLHYSEMVNDLPGSIARIADHVDIHLPAEVMEGIANAAIFKNMKARSDVFTPAAGENFWKTDAGFFDSGTSNKWEGRLSDADLAAYDEAISGMLDPEDRRWLEWGSMGSPS